MIYPQNYEQKIGFDEIRRMLKEHCQSSLGRERVDEITFSADAGVVNEQLEQVREMRRLMQATEKPEMNYFFDVRESVARIRMENTHLEEEELWDLRRSLETIGKIVDFLNRGEQQDVRGESIPLTTYPYPALHRMAADVQTFPAMIRRIDSILDKFGKIKDSASMTLAGIRHDMEQTAGSISRTLYTILHAAQRDGLVAQDVAPTLREGRLMIPVAPGMKRKINGIVHDESATGKTVFIEPAEVVEANNKVRELEAAERREIIRILTVFSDELRPHVQEVLDSYRFLAQIDLVHAKAEMAELMQAFEPKVKDEPMMDWIRAIHPLLQRSLAKQEKKVVPLDIMLKTPLSSPEGDTNVRQRGNEAPSGAVKGGWGRLLIISGPNAGGKSVCLKTVGLLQYMLQCGLSIPVGDRSTVGVFRNIMIDIGDEQSIADDLSTYSSHLLNMKKITTHYQNLKHFAEDHPGVVNGAMLYDRHQMQALFQLSIGQPGSSFAIEIARKTGIPEEVINDASEIVGSDYIQSDKYLQDIVRDKRYWEGKRQTIHQHEKRLEATGERLDASLEEIERERKAILNRAKAQAEELLAEANRKIENAIREIKEAQAEKEQTRLIREELQEFREQVQNDDTRGLMSEEDFAKKLQQMQERKARKAQRKEKKGAEQKAVSEKLAERAKASLNNANRPLEKGDTVRIKGTNSVGEIESIQGKQVTVIFGGLRSKVKLEQLERTDKPKAESTSTTDKYAHLAIQTSHMTRATMEDRRQNFHQDLDVRGMRGDDAIDTVMHFIDDAILIGLSRVRILHGTGSGILRQLIRQYLHTVPNVKNARDEHVQFGGAGITIVDLD